MKSVGMSKREMVIARTGAPGLKTLVNEEHGKMKLTGAALDKDGDKDVAYLVLDGTVYSSTAGSAVQAAEALIEANDGVDPFDEEFMTFDADVYLATSAKGRDYIAINLY